jgi:hypothetical protein
MGSFGFDMRGGHDQIDDQLRELPELPSPTGETSFTWRSTASLCASSTAASRTTRQRRASVPQGQ